MKPVDEWDEKYVLGIPPGEYDWVEFKGSELLTSDRSGNQLRSELSKQISAFANTSNGGTIVLGVKDHHTGQRCVDAGGIPLATERRITKEWLEDIIPHLVDYPLTASMCIR